MQCNATINLQNCINTILYYRYPMETEQKLNLLHIHFKKIIDKLVSVDSFIVMLNLSQLLQHLH